MDSSDAPEIKIVISINGAEKRTMVLKGDKYEGNILGTYEERDLMEKALIACCPQCISKPE